MKKSIVYSLLASVSMITTAAYADDPKASVLTTQRYVDDGLAFVYGVANGTEDGAVKDLKGTVGNTTMGTTANTVTGAISELNTAINGANGLDGRVEGLEDTVNNATTGLAKQVSDLKTQVDNLDNVSYEGENGVAVANGKVGLNIEEKTGNKAYVFETDGEGNGSWVGYSVATQWNGF